MWHTSTLNVPILSLCVIVILTGVSVGFISPHKVKEQAAITTKPFIYNAHEISELLKYLIVYVEVVTERNLQDIPDELAPIDSQNLETIARELLNALETSVRVLRSKVLDFIKRNHKNSTPDEIKIEVIKEFIEPNLKPETTSEPKSVKKTAMECRMMPDDSVECRIEEPQISLSEFSEEIKETKSQNTDCSSGDIGKTAGCQTESKSSEKNKSNTVIHKNVADRKNDNSLKEKDADFETPQAEDELEDYDYELLDRSGAIVEPYKRPSYIPAIGVIGQDFPDFTHIPRTQFSCNFIDHIPGFYADLETGCQVFHVCWPHRRESFLCPIGSTFNQKILSCDYWFNSDCSQSPDYFFLNEDLSERSNEYDHAIDDSLYTEVVDGDYSSKHFRHTLSLPKHAMKFTPILFTTHYYAGRPLHPDTPEFQKFDQDFPKHDDSSSSISDDEFHAIARKVYDQLFASSKNPREKYDALTEPWIVSEFLPSERIWNLDSDIDRSGDFEDQQSVSESDPSSTTMNISEAVTDSNFARTKKSKVVKFSKDQIAPVIVSKALETAENLVNKGILPFTKEILSASYGKLLKGKKH